MLQGMQSDVMKRNVSQCFCCCVLLHSTVIYTTFQQINIVEPVMGNHPSGKDNVVKNEGVVTREVILFR